MSRTVTTTITCDTAGCDSTAVVDHPNKIPDAWSYMHVQLPRIQEPIVDDAAVEEVKKQISQQFGVPVAHVRAPPVPTKMRCFHLYFCPKCQNGHVFDAVSQQLVPDGDPGCDDFDDFDLGDFDDA